MKTIVNVASLTYNSETTQITTYSNIAQTIIKVPNNRRVYYIVCEPRCCCNCCQCCHYYNYNNCCSDFIITK